MKHMKAIVTGILLVFVMSHAWGQDDVEATHNDYVRLLKATRYVQNIQRMAAASIRVSSERAPGSNPKMAQFMNVVATADLSDAEGCLADVYATQNLTQEDAQTLIAFFESPLGAKFMDHSERTFAASMAQGGQAPPPADNFSEAEEAQIEELQQDAAFVKYRHIVENQDVWAGMMKCVMDSNAVKKSGIRK